MPTIRPQSRKLAEFDTAADILVSREATGSHIFLTSGGSQYLSDLLPRTGNRPLSSLVAIAELLLNFGTQNPLQIDLGGYDVSIVVQTKGLTAAPNESWHRFFNDPMSGTPASLPQETTSELSPLVLSQVEQIVVGISPKLQERIRQFEANRDGQEPVSAGTRSAVNNLVTWLHSESETVSATVSNDGMLSIAKVFPNEVRLYIEIERNGSAGAVISRSRIHADDLPVSTVSQLTKEMVLDAVGGS